MYLGEAQGVIEHIRTATSDRRKIPCPNAYSTSLPYPSENWMIPNGSNHRCYLRNNTVVLETPFDPRFTTKILAWENR